jgi:hypothetical protein
MAWLVCECPGGAANYQHEYIFTSVNRRESNWPRAFRLSSHGISTKSGPPLLLDFANYFFPLSGNMKDFSLAEN